MAKLLFALSVVGLVVWVYTLVDCIRTDDSRVRGLPKIAWVFVVIALPLIGSVLWFFIGKERRTRIAPRQPSQQRAPDDDPAFLGKIGMEQDREQRIRRLEERLAELDDDNNNQKD
ncbi:MAG: PLD nuclease N-terminal domain-containing protein [Homoserinimonas sp.]